MFGFGLLRLPGEWKWARLQVSHSPRLSLLCTKSPSSTEQFTAHLQLPSRSSACSKILWKATSIPTAAPVSSFQFILRLYHCRLHPLAPLPERMSSNCSDFFWVCLSKGWATTSPVTAALSSPRPSGMQNAFPAARGLEIPVHLLGSGSGAPFIMFHGRSELFHPVIEFCLN